MSSSTYLKVAIVVGNAIVLVGSYAFASYCYKISKIFKKESERLKNGGTTSYENLT